MTPTSEEIEERAKKIAAQYQIVADWGVVDECVRLHYRKVAKHQIDVERRIAETPANS